jgi:PAS domain S-box-containing protein
MNEEDVTPAAAAPSPYPEALFFLNPQGEFTFLNDAFTQLTGYSAAALHGRPLTQLLAPATQPDRQPLLQRALLGEVLTFEVSLLNPAGPPLALTITTFPRLSQAGLLGIAGLVRVALPPPENVAQAPNELLSVIFCSLADIIFVLQVEPDEQYRFMFVNQAFVDTTGVAADQVVGRYVQDVIPEPSLSLVLAHYRQAVASRQRVVWMETSDYPSGQLIGEVSVTPVFGDAGDCQLVGIVHDLTAQKRVEEHLRASNERFAYALKATTDALYDWDIAADTLHWGEGFAELFGYHLLPNPTPFQQWSDSVHPDDATRTVDDLLHITSHTRQTHWQQEYRFQRADGSWANVFDRGYIIRDDTGRATRMIGAMQDISERKAAEEKQQLLAQALFKQNSDLRQFTYIVSHNLRAPLANARGFVDLLRRVDKASEVFDVSLGHLQASIQQLDAILTDINDILSIRDQQETRRPEPVSLADVCTQVRQNLAAALHDCGGSISCAIPDELQVQGIRAYFYSIFYNLLANAIKYRSQQRPLQVEVVGSSIPGQGVVLTVTDNGSGFDQEKAGANVFQLYKRFHAGHPGRGIGLFLVRSHLEAMGGRVEVSSRIDEGTRFTLYLS